MYSFGRYVLQPTNVLSFLGAFRKATVRFDMPVRMEQLGSHWSYLMKFFIWVFFQNISRKLKFYENWTRITGTSLEDRCTFLIISRPFLLIMKTVSDKSCRKKTHFLFSNFLFFEYHPVYEVVWKIIVDSGRPQMTSMAHAHCRLDTKGYNYTLSISNTYCISTVTMVARSRLIITLFVQYSACVVKA